MKEFLSNHTVADDSEGQQLVVNVSPQLRGLLANPTNSEARKAWTAYSETISRQARAILVSESIKRPLVSHALLSTLKEMGHIAVLGIFAHIMRIEFRTSGYFRGALSKRAVTNTMNRAVDNKTAIKDSAFVALCTSALTEELFNTLKHRGKVTLVYGTAAKAKKRLNAELEKFRSDMVVLAEKAENVAPSYCKLFISELLRVFGILVEGVYYTDGQEATSGVYLDGSMTNPWRMPAAIVSNILEFWLPDPIAHNLYAGVFDTQVRRDLPGSVAKNVVFGKS